MNVLILDQFSEPGGAQFCLRDLIPEILRRGWKAQLMTPGNGLLVEWCHRWGIPACELPLSAYSNGNKTLKDYLQFAVDVPRAACAVRAAIHQHGADVVYVNGPRALPAVVGLGCPIVFHAHNHVRGWPGRKLIQLTLAASNASVIAVSNYVASDYAHAHIIRNGVDDLQIGPGSFRRRTIRVGILGRIAAEKGQLDFVRAAKQLLQRGADAEYFVYGSRLFSDPVYEARVRSAAEGAPVEFCGWADDVAIALHNLEVLAVPSGPDEAAARVIIEAFSAGTSVVAYRSGGIPELIDHRRTGLLTRAADAESLAAAIGKLIEDRQLMERLSAEGRKEWSRRFRVEQFRSNVCDLLERCGQSTIGERREGWERASGSGAARGA